MVICIDVAKSVNGERLPLEPPDLNFEYANFISAGDGSWNWDFITRFWSIEYTIENCSISFIRSHLEDKIWGWHNANAFNGYGLLALDEDYIYIDNTDFVIHSRKLKRKSHTDLNLEDDHPIDHVPSSSKATIKAKPIAHGSPLMPYNTTAKLICIANCQECVFFLGVNQQPFRFSSYAPFAHITASETYPFKPFFVSSGMVSPMSFSSAITTIKFHSWPKKQKRVEKTAGEIALWVEKVMAELELAVEEDGELNRKSMPLRE
ncbi:hypothetical protein IFM89_012186 [Coptis chinensis]|uniref:Uncharacterized protein n=1 Tax=Coptis chinensis TaxID=261450 RepID=A0A835LQ48_9MAGN|nr:hypothetical protein IFM89_012186 [Coptis chinensis]